MTFTWNRNFQLFVSEHDHEIDRFHTRQETFRAAGRPTASFTENFALHSYSCYDYREVAA